MSEHGEADDPAGSDAGIALTTSDVSIRSGVDQPPGDTAQGSKDDLGEEEKDGDEMREDVGDEEEGEEDEEVLAFYFSVCVFCYYFLLYITRNNCSWPYLERAHTVAQEDFVQNMFIVLSELHRNNNKSVLFLFLRWHDHRLRPGL